MANDPRFEVYPREDGAYGWRFRAANGQISAIGGEGFTRADDAERAVEDLVADVIQLRTAVVAKAKAAGDLPPTPMPIVRVDS